MHSLLSGNLMDVCPVGAITTRDYRFKSRPWDNPLAVDTICTLCSKGCSTTAWLKAKPEWAKGAQLIRFTPRFNPDVNGYWMCDIGRFEYHWVEGDARLTHPARCGRPRARRRRPPGAAPSPRCANGCCRLRRSRPAAFRMLVSAHASHEELFLVRQLVGADARRECRVGGGRVVAIVREGAARGDEVHGAAGRRAERGRRARDGLPRAGRRRARVRRQRAPQATSKRAR